MAIIHQAYQFQTDGKPIFCTPFGKGHINFTYLLVDATARQYVLQKINKHVFKNPESVMKNISAVTTHLRQIAQSLREALSLVPTVDGQDWLVDQDGEYWRLYTFISDSICLQKAGNSAEFRESGWAFGHFQCSLVDYPADTLAETIPDFHHTPMRFAALHAAIAADAFDRVKTVEKEIMFALEREAYASTLTKLAAAGSLPLRVTHNDTKLNNVLLDRETRKALCVIDLDTVMPGLSVNDFGDSIRFGANAAAEDEPDTAKAVFLLPLFEAYTEGFLSAFGRSLCACEKEHLRDGAKMMTLECGIRFLADYLSGDTYFRTSRDGQNLDRCRTQFKLVADMEACWDQMAAIVSQYC